MRVHRAGISVVRSFISYGIGTICDLGGAKAHAYEHHLLFCYLSDRRLRAIDDVC